MKILVGVKRVIEASVHIRLKPDGTGVMTDNCKMAMNPFDEIALEEAVRLKEKGIAQEVVAVSIGQSVCQDILRSALALGADRAILVESDLTLSPLMIAKILHRLVAQENPELVIVGKQAIDSDDNQVGQMLAGLLDWPQGTFASRLEVESPFIKVTREIDGGLQTLKLKLPAVVTTDLRLNEPRYLSLPNIVKAKQKKIQFIPLAEMTVNTTAQVHTLNVSPPPQRRAGIKVNSVSELVDKLKFEAKVLP